MIVTFMRKILVYRQTTTKKCTLIRYSTRHKFEVL